MKKTTHDVTMGNLLSDGIGLIGVLFSTSISFVLTLLCCASDFMQIFQLFDSVMHESQTMVIISSLTIVFFLNFSMFIAATVIKQMSCGQTAARKTGMSLFCIFVAFVLFLAAFLLTFQFKYALRDTLFSLDSNGVEGVVNKVVQAGADAINRAAPSTVNEADVIRIAAVLMGAMPAFTSLLSALSVFMFMDPIDNKKAKLRAELLLYRYRAYVTNRKLAALSREISSLEMLPKQYADAIHAEQERYARFVDGVCKGEQAALVAHYTAATEVFKADQNIVTELSKAAKSIPVRDMNAILGEPSIQEVYSPSLEETISDAESLFDVQTRTVPANTVPSCESSVVSVDTYEDVAESVSNEEASVDSPDTMTDTPLDSMYDYPSKTSEYPPADELDDSSATSDEHTPTPHPIPDAFVASWLQTAANQ